MCVVRLSTPLTLTFSFSFSPKPTDTPANGFRFLGNLQSTEVLRRPLRRRSPWLVLSTNHNINGCVSITGKEDGVARSFQFQGVAAQLMAQSLEAAFPDPRLKLLPDCVVFCTSWMTC
mmetsp:Transcript_3504/g.5454  ORF Transcript_3504/g.5454 Transcript_3504/m.5454 type:complete len:118 (+) Transcript_3504:116-469(+)